MKPALIVHLEIVRQNVEAWRRFIPGRSIWAVVKCDAYRMGIVEISRAVLEGGAERLCVVEISEAVALRAAGLAAPIVHIAATPRGDFALALRNDVIVSLGDVDDASELDRVAKQLGVRARAHVAVETGTGWWGVPSAEAGAFAKRVHALEHIEWEGVWTHIAGPDAMPNQHKRFTQAIDELRKSGLGVPEVHAASTGPAIWGLSDCAARIGIGLYGSTLGVEARVPSLRTAFEVRAPVYAIRKFTEPTPLGYGGTYTALPGQSIVTLRIGYGEGLPKTLSGRGYVSLAGAHCPIVGAIGMNFTMVAVPPNVDVSQAGEALIVGNERGLTLDAVAAAAQMIPHNIVTEFGAAIAPEYTASLSPALRHSR